jgi:hypothetical protein
MQHVPHYNLALKTAAADVMKWADPHFAYDHLAITRNFVGGAVQVVNPVDLTLSVKAPGFNP